MVRTATLCLMMVIYSTFISAQTKFQIHMGGTTIGNMDISRPTNDGGYIFAGTNQLAPYDIFLIKVDSVAGMTWSRTFGHVTGSERLYEAIQTTDGGYMLAGNSVLLYNYSMFFVKTDSNGDTLFTRTFGGSGSETATTIIQTNDGGYLAAGTTADINNPPNTSLLLYKMNAAGDSSWSTVLSAPGVSSGEVARSVNQTSDGGYIIAGEYNFGQFQRDCYLIKIDSVGNVLWNKTYQLPGGAIVASAQQTSDDGFIIGGNYVPPGGLYNKLYLIRTNSLGDTLWTSVYGGPALDNFGWVQQTSDGGFIQCGLTENFGANSGGDGYMIKTTSTGTLSWSYRYGGISADQFSSVHQTPDNGYIVGGYTASFGSGYLYAVKTDSVGISNCYQTATPTIRYTPPVTIGTTALSNAPANAWISIPTIAVGSIDTTVNTICFISTDINEINSSILEVAVYPNPATTQIHVKLNIKNSKTGKYFLTNALGQKMLSGLLHSLNEESILNIESFPSGIYILTIISEDSLNQTQIVKQ
ncbi:MAG: T9SS type A sorting domain-containing protein [Bacteroidetes bacterium]|nr:T9SS type A sorting domain-containing protein [Bacteroidota bacterium]